MLKRVQNDKKKGVIPNLSRNLDFGNGKESFAFVLLSVIHYRNLGFVWELKFDHWDLVLLNRISP